MRLNEIPNGTMDLINIQCETRENLILRINNLFKSWGYKKVITPTIEYYKVINSGFESFKEQDIYKAFDNNGRILVLRPDMTIPIARLVGSKFKGVKKPLRLSYTSNIFRVNKELLGQKNESTHCGIELIGEWVKGSDLEVIILAIESLKLFNFKKFKIEITHVGIFNELCIKAELDLKTKNKLASLIEEKKIKELEDLLADLTIDVDYKDIIKKLPWLVGGKEILEFNEKLELNSLKYLKTLAKTIEELGYEEFICFNLGRLPRINYYTGLIFSAYVEGYGDFVLNGGRYDNLLKVYGEANNAVGFSINIDALAEINTLNLLMDSKEKIILEYKEENFIDVIKEADHLRSMGKIVEIKLKRSNEYGS
ncbi:ATP phosphoribosyltransferase regulatory subunit [Clostridium cavendishii DSM 21758]|uniref:ATP phosphoribosyltransferase regulatory subunit n=1 Tax=Clostridium cavendishii DSM 21758 TaxID=1121302 RepID=A0A1M6F142_9CLOT|nr:ATP phosphoribosyltransferase regulatory subunit [Clostridium cavendishii]SHI91448.1 ATP phosphoribosyltransferase regulatory subunit [Clostridium cavendishii DSM 21758]